MHNTGHIATTKYQYKLHAKILSLVLSIGNDNLSTPKRYINIESPTRT